MPAIVTASSLTRRFGRLTAVNALSFSVERGEVFGIVGPDGAGKTTTLRMLTGILEPSAGTASVAGFDVGRESELVKERIGYMSQRFGLYSDLTVMENITFYADLYSVPVKGRSEAVGRLLEFSNLAPFKDRLAGNLSGGMKQKLGLACTLIHKPLVLFLDEPTNGVDPVSRRDFWRILYQLLREQVTIIVTTSYLDEAERCSRVGLLHNGALLACDTPAQAKERMRGAVLEVRTPEPRRAAGLLRGHVEAQMIDLFGDRVHVATTEPGQAAVQARAVLEAGGLEVQSIRRIEPTLEDVFVSMLSRAEEEGDGRRG